MSGMRAEWLRAPFPWYGGKRRVADRVWQMLGNCDRYVEPFAGSLGVLLGRPTPFRGVEVVNDLDGYVVNAWRAIKCAPDATAGFAVDLVSELDLTARHLWLVNEGRGALSSHLAADPDWFDARIAGWWLQGVAGWIGSGFCSGRGPWTRARLLGGGDDGRGVNRQLPHLGNDGRGVNRQLPHLGNDGQGAAVTSWMRELAARLSRVIVASGDFQRVLTPSATAARNANRVGVFLDPPYRQHGNEYGVGDEGVEDVWRRIESWAETVPANMAVVLCGYEGDFTTPDGWREIAYTAAGVTANRTRERFWVSPACHGEQSLFDAGGVS